VEVFQQYWRADRNWVNPPFTDIPRVLDNIHQDRATATVIVTTWTAQTWLLPALRIESEAFHLLLWAGVSPRGAGGEPGHRPHWRVCALRFLRSRRAPPPWRGHEQRRRSVPVHLEPARGARPPPLCLPTSWST